MMFRTFKKFLTVNFVLLAILPALAIGIVNLKLMTRNLEVEISTKNHSLAISLAGEVERFLNEHLNLLLQVKDSIEVEHLIAADSINEYLASILRNYRFFDMIQVLDHDGLVTQIAPLSSDFIGTSMKNQLFYQQTVLAKKAVWSPTFISMQTGQPTLTLSVPMKNGLVVGYLNLNILGEISEKIRLGEISYAVITDQNGTVISHLKKEMVSQRHNMRFLKVVREGLDGKFGTFRETVSGEEMLISLSKVSPTEWLVMFFQPTSEAFASIEATRRIIIVGALITVIIALLVTVFSLRKALGPLNHLMGTVKKVAEGDYENPEIMKSFREFEELAAGFGKMTQAVKQRQDALEASTRELAFHVKNTPLGVIQWDKNFRVAEWNKSAEKIFGYSEEEALGNHAADLIVPKNITTDIDSIWIDLLKREGGYKSINENLTKSGEKIVCEWYNTPLLDDEQNTIGVASMVQDITHRKKAETSLRLERDKLQTLMDGLALLGIGVNIIGIDHRIEFQNQTLIDSFGDSSGKLCFTTYMGLNEPCMRCPKNRSIRENKVMSAEIVDTNGRNYEILTAPLPNSDGTVDRAIEVLRDNTEQKKTKELLMQTEKMMSVGGLAAGMAHELNNPLGGMIQGAQNILRRLSPTLLKNRETADRYNIDLEQLQHYLEDRKIVRFLYGIQESGDRAAKIIKNMLQFSRRSDSYTTPILLSDLIDHVIELAHNDFDLKKKYDFRNVKIVKEYERNMKPVSCIETEIEQVVLNLLKNSAQAMSETDQLVSPSIAIRTLTEGKLARIEIEDRGPGIEEEVKKRIFEPFFTTKPVGTGTGLGLSVTFMIITNNHNGSIEVESKLGKGTRFIIKLPFDYKGTPAEN